MVSNVQQSFVNVVFVFENKRKSFLRNIDVRRFELSLFSRKKLSDKYRRLGTHNLEVETSCIKQAKKTLHRHLPRFERLLKN